jgi:hypothetical protein
MRLGGCRFQGCTITGHLHFQVGGSDRGAEGKAIDCIVSSIEADDPAVEIPHCNVYGSPPFVNKATPGKGFIDAKPQFRDPANLDYRPMPGSLCIGKASDGGDIGCRYTPEMIELCKTAVELRKRGLIKF